MKFSPLLLLSFFILSCTPNQPDLSFLGKQTTTSEFNGNWVLTSSSIFDNNLKFYNINLPDTVISYARTYKINDSLINYELIVNKGWVCGNGLLEFDTITHKIYTNKILLSLVGSYSLDSKFNYQGVYSIKKTKDTLYLEIDTILLNIKEDYFSE
jgi:hypothetical protein